MAEYRPYLMRLSSRSLVEPNFIRLILTGDEVRFPQPCLDRRIKLLFIGEHPNPALTDPKVGDGWYQLWLDDPARPEMRTYTCLLYTSPSPRDLSTSRMPSSA